ncbi:MAG: hypothetical protein KJO42_08185 [Silicimonas sp.]|nr:hypothetical protein [Silicimonas sp.]MBT8423789.1 hypothetical protein [Silicimonas sp.]NND41529.1 hypothetical protein [Silicimonas sp.]RZW06235.1 MAG: hypothetical protein EX266_07825 [Paracoccaceae bacterium]
MAKSKNKKAGLTAIHQSAIVEDEFGNYRIRAGRLSGNFVARAFPKTGSRSQGLMAEVSAASEGEAIAELKRLLGDRDARRLAARRWEPRCHVSVPSKEEFTEALKQTKMSEAQLSMLKSHSLAGEAGMTMTALMKSAGYRSPSTAIKVIGRAGALIADFLHVELPPADAQVEGDAARVLSFCESRGEGSPQLWVMHDELRQAVSAAL